MHQQITTKPKPFFFKKGKKSNKKDSVDAAVVLGVVGHLGILAPNDLPAGGDEAEVAHVDLDDRTLGDHAELCVHGGLGVLLDADDIQVERTLELRVGHVSLCETECHRSDETLVFRRLPSEPLPDKSDLCDHTLVSIL